MRCSSIWGSPLQRKDKRSFVKGIEMWKEETVLKKAMNEEKTIVDSQAKLIIDADYEKFVPKEEKTTSKIMRDNLDLKRIFVLLSTWIFFLLLQVTKAVHDGVDILNLSVGPNSPPATTKTTYLNPFDATLLAAVKAGVFVVQAAGNGGPFPKTLLFYSPWIATVAAAVDDRRYKNHLNLGNGKILAGIGLSLYKTQVWYS